MSAALTGGFEFISNLKPKTQFGLKLQHITISHKSTSNKFRTPLRADFDLSQTTSPKPNFDSNISLYPFHKNKPLKNFVRPCGRISLYLKFKRKTKFWLKLQHIPISHKSTSKKCLKVQAPSPITQNQGQKSKVICILSKQINQSCKISP